MPGYFCLKLLFFRAFSTPLFPGVENLFGTRKIRITSEKYRKFALASHYICLQPNLIYLSDRCSISPCFASKRHFLPHCVCCCCTPLYRLSGSFFHVIHCCESCKYYVQRALSGIHIMFACSFLLPEVIAQILPRCAHLWMKPDH